MLKVWLTQKLDSCQLFSGKKNGMKKAKLPVKNVNSNKYFAKIVLFNAFPKQMIERDKEKQITIGIN